MLGFDVDADVGKPSQRLRAEYRKWAKKGADKGFAFSQEVVPEDRGTLRQSGFPPEFDQNDVLRWGYQARQARPMEFGTEPFVPPLKPLVEWAERVAGDPGLGYYVAREKIPEEGIDAQPHVRPGRNVQKEWYQSHPFSERFED